MQRLQSDGAHAAAGNRPRRRSAQGFTVPELLVVLLVGAVLTAIAIPVISSALASMRMTSMITDVSGAISRTRYRAIMTSQAYTVVITVPANSFVVTNVATGAADRAVPLAGNGVLINGGAAAVYTFTFCPNGTVYGAGGVCPNVTVPPVLTASYQGRITTINTSSVGNVTTTIIHE